VNTMSELNLIRTGRRGTSPVVLLHSAGLDLTYWEHQIAALRPDHDVVAIDLPGHGRSKAAPTAITLEHMTHAVISAIAGLDVGPVGVVGLSVGGLIAQAVALENPAAVSSLVLVDTAARFTPAGQDAMRLRAETARREGMSAVLDGLFEHWFLPETRRQRPELIDRATKTLLGADPNVHAALWEMIADFDVLGRLPEVTAPTLVLVGEHDSSSPVSAARTLRDAIAGAELHVVADAAHLAPLERPDDVTSHIAAFLGQKTTSRTGQ